MSMDGKNANGAGRSPRGAVGRLLITAGPTHEPIDAVRFIGNRSSGRLGVALARAACDRGWEVTLLLGPGVQAEADGRAKVERFRTTADLEGVLKEKDGCWDVLVMAAAVADYRPKRVAGPGEKLRRTEAGLVIELESTPDLLRGVAARRRDRNGDGYIVGFALEPRERLMESAREKLARKGIDAVVANPLETMDAGGIEAVLVTAEGREEATGAVIDKAAFGVWLMERIEAAVASRKAARASDEARTAAGGEGVRVG